MIKDLKIYDAVTCSENDRLINVAKLIKEKGIRHVYVLNKENQPVGVISTVDINNKAVAMAADISKLKAEDIMNSPVDYVDINQEVEFAMKIMIQRKTYSCLVTENGKIKGIVDYKSVMDRIIKKVRED